MNAKWELLKNTGIIAISRLSSGLLAFLMLPLMTTSLTQADYGIVDLAISYSSIVVSVVLLNLDLGVFRYLVDIRDNRRDVGSVISTAFRACLPVILLFSLLFLGASYILSLSLAPWVYCYLLATSAGIFVQQISRGLGRTISFAISGIIQTVVTATGIVISLLVTTSGASGVLLSYAFGSLAAVVYCLIACRLTPRYFVGPIDRQIRRELLKYSLPLIPNSLSFWIFGLSDRTIISIVLGLSANGVYGVSNRFSLILTTLVSVFYLSWSESAALNIHTNRASRLFSDVLDSGIYFISYSGVVLVSCVGAFFSFIVDESFSDAYYLIPPLVLAVVFNFVATFFGGVFTAMKLTKPIMTSSILAAIINIATTVSLVFFIGLWAAVLATLLSYGFLAVYRFLQVQRRIVVEFKFSTLLKCSMLFCSSFLCYYCLPPSINIFSLLFVVALGFILGYSRLKSIAILVAGRLRK